MSDTGFTVPAAAPPASTSPVKANAPRGWSRFFHWMVEANVVMVTALAIFSGLFVGAVLIIATQANVLHAWSLLFSHPGTTVSVTFFTVGDAYRDLFTGSLGDPFVIGHAIATGHGWGQALTPLSETLLYASPLCVAGLAVGLGFRTGMFNIGGQGQLIAGAMAASYVGFEIDPPAIIHVPLCILAGFAGGAVAGFIPGFLKARTGAHEVIVTIMLNYVFLNLLVLALTTQPFQQPHQANAVGRTIFGSAELPHIFGQNLRVNVGVFIAIACALGVSWLLRRGTLGFGFRVVGANQDAAKVAGINVRRATILVLVISGGLAGLGKLVLEKQSVGEPEPPDRHRARLAAVRRAERRWALHAGVDRDPARPRLGHPGDHCVLRRHARPRQRGLPVAGHERRPGSSDEGLGGVSGRRAAGRWGGRGARP